ncbi:fasciclin domain-containing protein [Hyphomonas chukchiensis]|uniref:FAS1 domain-containing protein n=1 Tax=Hyphomonas chukchiensis TaxID=1280947 RepID=A0A062UM04_9PROT|nr:fasciclin domain-containing protein [Hyphomonas chukchiensis]KCZ59951.1 hypothetical protein HY30_13050 [Hyphomonas chukchiensis]
MKRLLIIPATVALLTGLTATAQESNENADAVKTSAAVMTESNDQASLDGMTIEQLNAMQLERLKTAATDSADSETTFQVATSSTTSANTDTAPMDMNATTETETDMAANMSTETVTPYADTETTEMGGPDYKTEADASAHADMPGTLADVAMDDARFTTLVSLVKLAGLDETLKNDGPYTLFAPTNDAFDKLDPSVVAHLTSEEGKPELVALLKGHVIDGEYDAADISQGETNLTTLASTTMDIERSGDMVMADDVDVVATDIKASNGVIHAIDTVIMEPADADETSTDEMNTSTEM